MWPSDGIFRSVAGAELLLIFAFPVLLAVPVVAVRFLGSKLVAKSGADRSIAVPIADAQSGVFPKVCAKTGRKSTGVAEERTDSFDTRWVLLVLAGPVGIVALGIIWARSNRSATAVDVPLSEQAFDQIQQSISRNNVTAGLAGVSVLTFAVLAAIGIATVWLVLLAAVSLLALAAWIVAATTAKLARVRLRLDEPHRLVHLDGVHPDFVAAVQKKARAEGRM